VEDAIAGVEAGSGGRFGCVIGVDHGGRSQALREAGADLVVTSLAQVKIAVEPPSAWSLVFEDFDPAREGIREALCTLGNGYFATRGATLSAVADGIHYPGTYLACGYNRLRTDIAGRVVENEDLVNLPNWLILKFRIGDGDWFDERTVRILSYRQELDLRRGMLLRNITFEDSRSRRTTLKERRLVSMSDMHLAALELSIVPENWSATISRPFGDRRSDRECGREALSQIQQQTPRASRARSSGRRYGVHAGADLPVPCSRRTSRTHQRIRGR
jgi:trehalose/maltose hydrolase-like predicted phosphorylase